jgi:hypothetical protein
MFLDGCVRIPFGDFVDTTTRTKIKNSSYHEKRELIFGAIFRDPIKIAIGTRKVRPKIRCKIC